MKINIIPTGALAGWSTGGWVVLVRLADRYRLPKAHHYPSDATGGEDRGLVARTAAGGRATRSRGSCVRGQSLSRSDGVTRPTGASLVELSYCAEARSGAVPSGPTSVAIASDGP